MLAGWECQSTLIWYYECPGRRDRRLSCSIIFKLAKVGSCLTDNASGGQCKTDDSPIKWSLLHKHWWPRTGVPCVSARHRSVSIIKLGFKFRTHMSNPPYFVSHPLHTYKEDCMLMNKAQTFSISPLVKISFTFATNSKSHVLLEQALRQNSRQMAIIGKRPLLEHRHCALKRERQSMWI